MKNDKKKNSKVNSPKRNRTATKKNEANGENESELRQPIWSVVSFEQCVSKNLTYAAAAAKISELEKKGVSGLCLVTDAVADRIAKN